MAGWETLKVLVREEIRQREEEGCDVTGFYERWERAGDDEAELMRIYGELTELKQRPDFPYFEPSELQDIRAERPEGPRKLAGSLSDEEWMDKFSGAWLGRCAGCALGKPLEVACYMSGTEKTNGNPGWLNVKLWFEGADAWPIRGYTPGASRAREELGLRVSCPRSQKENLKFMETDDDIRYTVLGLKMLEDKGLAFDSFDVGRLWHEMLTYRQVCTAETQAYLNFAGITSHKRPNREHWESRRNWVRTWLNPYREWIGAQIRADGYAYGAAGQPELAAELAWRDASFSHTKNGIYGAMFMAAVISAAFVESDAERLIAIGLSEIPRNCRLAHDIRRATEIARDARKAGPEMGQLQLVERIWETFKHYHPVHTNNNAALVAAAVLFAGDDFELAIATAVLGGWDTDCNGATVGSIMGAKLGAKKLPERWISPLNDTLYAGIAGFHPIRITECARRSYEVFRKLSAGQR
jgi:ADP-ribosylglycohydrolase